MMKAIALKRVLLAASLLAPTACAERIAECQPAGGRELAAGAVRCSTDNEAPEVALDDGLTRGPEEAEPVLSVAPPQRRKSRPAMHARSAPPLVSQPAWSLSAPGDLLAVEPTGQSN